MKPLPLGRLVAKLYYIAPEKVGRRLLAYFLPILCPLHPKNIRHFCAYL